jgi:hydroxypyruvate reductase
LLLECGASIDEINAIRKHLSRSKGGALAKAAHPATVISLFLSDVVGDRLDVIASGPTVPDVSTFGECIEIIDRYGLGSRIPENVLQFLTAGRDGEIEETPKGSDVVFTRVQNVVVGSNRLALMAAGEKAIELGYGALMLTSSLQGEAREVAQVLAAVGREIRGSGHPIVMPACVLAGGETTVTIRGSGKGGRNQELALAAAAALAGSEGIAILSAGTDGTDGPTDAAGAYADGATCSRGLLLGMDPRDHLQRNDAYPFFAALDDLLSTGPTRTNVMDLIVMIVE